MQKIMFNDKYGLTKAVLERRKTQTRRIVTYHNRYKGIDVAGFYAYRRPSDRVIVELCMYDEDEIPIDEGQILPKYKIGEIVAVAQSICDIYAEWDMKYLGKDTKELMEKFGGSPCFKNKMFVKSSEMPHQIRITNVRIERLQDISDEDCLKEGILKCQECGECYFIREDDLSDCSLSYDNPKKAYAALIDKVSGKGTWESNPYVFVYDFELVK